MNELWTISGRDPVNWTVPFYVELRDDCAVLTCGVALMARQRVAVANLMSIYGYRNEGAWVLKPGVLESIGERTRGGDPEMYFVWSAPKPKPLPTPGAGDRSEMAEAMYKAGIGETEAHAHVLWTALCRLIAHRLINDEKPVDMYFFQLHNCPYRINWLTIVTQRIRRRLYGNEEEELSGFTDLLESTDLLSYNRRNSLCYRHVEIEHSQRWWKLVTRAESDRMKVKGAHGYADYFLDSLRRFYPVARRIYNSWLAQIRTNSVACTASGPRGRIRFMSASKVKDLSPLHHEFCALPPVFSPREALRRAKAVSKTYGIVPAVPDFQQKAENVWDGEGGPSRPDVDSSEGEAAANGMPLLPSVEKLA